MGGGGGGILGLFNGTTSKNSPYIFWPYLSAGVKDDQLSTAITATSTMACYKMIVTFFDIQTLIYFISIVLYWMQFLLAGNSIIFLMVLCTIWHEWDVLLEGTSITLSNIS